MALCVCVGGGADACKVDEIVDGTAEVVIAVIVLAGVMMRAWWVSL